jgi:hypothetical protein
MKCSSEHVLVYWFHSQVVIWLNSIWVRMFLLFPTSKFCTITMFLIVDLETIFHTGLQVCLWPVSPLKFTCLAHLVHWFIYHQQSESWKCDAGVASINVMSVPSFMKVVHLIQKLKGWIQTTWWSHNLTVFRGKGSGLIISSADISCSSLLILILVVPSYLPLITHTKNVTITVMNSNGRTTM